MGTGPSSRRRGNGSNNNDQNIPPSSSQYSSAPPRNGNYVFAAPTPYPTQHSQQPQPYYPAARYNPPMAASLDPQMHSQGSWSYGMRPSPSAAPPSPPAHVEHQKAITIRNDVNLKKETVRLERDEEDPGRYLVAFTFDATVSGSISIFFFAKEGANCSLTSLKAHIIKPVRVSFEKGLGQKFRQPTGTGIDLSLFDDIELFKEGPDEVFPIAVRAEAGSMNNSADALFIASEQIGDPLPKSVNSQITQAIVEKKDNGDYKVKVVKQILWVDGVRYELQEIYGIGNSVGSDFDGNDPGKECVICMSEPRDTTILPCRHMCLCSECAKVLRFQTNRCPICRRPVERLLEIKVNRT
eukprot:Gb_23799 [translate_table: standard]